MQICPTPHCGRRTDGKYCVRCRRLRDAARGNAIARGYGSDWNALAADWLIRFPYCGQRMDGALYLDDSECCRLPPFRQRGDVVDHIRPISAGGDRLDPANLQTLCWSCNSRKRTRP